MKNHYLSFLLLLLVEGVFSDVMMSVMEGDSVTLQIDVTEIQGAEMLLWTFDGQSEFIAKINREYNRIMPVPPKNVERFKNRLKVDQIGSLTITNISTADAALYTLEISSSGPSSYKRFRVTVYRVSDVEMKSVIKGEYVILQTDATEIQTDDEILWSYFTPEETVIARVTIGNDYKPFTVFDDDADVIFRERVFVNSKTGSLIISDVRSKHSGLYKLEVIRSQTTSKMFRVTVSDEFKVTPVSVMEGESVTLSTDVPQTLTDELLLWTFDTEGIVIAKINRAHNQSSVYNGTDEKFRDRLKLDHQTGSLTISNIRTEHSGHYSLKISSTRGTKYNRFNVNVKERPPVAFTYSAPFPTVLLLVAAAGVGVGAGAVVIYYRCCKKQKTIGKGARGNDSTRNCLEDED